jgi:hypothetical protein
MQILADKKHDFSTPMTDRNPQWSEYMESFYLPIEPDGSQGLKG